MQVPSALRGRVGGLCGNYNSDQADDKQGRSGQRVVSSKMLTEAWRVAGYPPCVPVTVPTVIQKKAFQICSTIRFPPFNLCQDIVPKNTFMSKCKDLTEECLNGDTEERECRCKAMEEYVRDCKGRDRSLHLEDWRTLHLCREYFTSISLSPQPPTRYSRCVSPGSDPPGLFPPPVSAELLQSQGGNSLPSSPQRSLLPRLLLSRRFSKGRFKVCSPNTMQEL